MADQKDRERRGRWDEDKEGEISEGYAGESEWGNVERQRQPRKLPKKKKRKRKKGGEIREGK